MINGTPLIEIEKEGEDHGVHGELKSTRLCVKENSLTENNATGEQRQL